MYKLFMLIALPVLGACWIGYAIWLHKIRKEEKSQPKQVSERLSKTRSEIVEWAKKMKSTESPRERALRRRRELEAQQQKGQQGAEESGPQ